MTRIPSLPLAALAGEMLRAPRVSVVLPPEAQPQLTMSDLLDAMSPEVRAVVKGSMLEHASGPWLDLAASARSRDQGPP